jgi:hypothetical protein
VVAERARAPVPKNENISASIISYKHRADFVLMEPDTYVVACEVSPAMLWGIARERHHGKTGERMPVPFHRIPL